MQPTQEPEPAVQGLLYQQASLAAAAVVAAWQPRARLVGYELCEQGVVQLTFLFASTEDEVMAEELGYYASMRLAVLEQLQRLGSSPQMANSVYIGFASKADE